MLRSQRRLATRRVEVELAQLQPDAFTDGACADAGGIHRLDVRENSLDFGGRRDELRLQIACDLFERLDHITVVVDGVDDGGADAHFALVQARHLKLPGQVFLQRFAARVGKILRLVVAAARPWRFGRPRNLRVAPFRIINQVDIGCGFPIVDSSLDSGEARGRRGLELAVRATSPLSRLPDSSSGSSMTLVSSASRICGLKLEHWQLQQADGLLQLRRHRELLAES